MSGFIEQFYYGNVDPQARGTQPNSKVRRGMQMLSDCEETLSNRLTGEDKRIFLAYINDWSLVNCEGNLDSFIVGFRLGAAFMHDTFLSDKAPYADFSKEV